MGYPAIPWSFMVSYIRAYRALLRRAQGGAALA